MYSFNKKEICIYIGKKSLYSKQIQYIYNIITISTQKSHPISENMENLNMKIQGSANNRKIIKSPIFKKNQGLTNNRKNHRIHRTHRILNMKIRLVIIPLISYYEGNLHNNHIFEQKIEAKWGRNGCLVV